MERITNIDINKTDADGHNKKNENRWNNGEHRWKEGRTYKERRKQFLLRMADLDVKKDEHRRKDRNGWKELRMQTEMDGKNYGYRRKLMERITDIDRI